MGDFKQTNASDNPTDAEGKTARDREVEAAKNDPAPQYSGSGQTAAPNLNYSTGEPYAPPHLTVKEQRAKDNAKLKADREANE